MVQTLCQNSVASRRNLETAFSAGRLVYFPRRQQNVIDLYYFKHFLPLLFSCIRCSFEQNTRRLIVYLRDQKTTFSFFFLLHFWGHSLGSHNLWTLPFSFWLRPCKKNKFWKMMKTSSPASHIDENKTTVIRRKR